MGTAVANAIPVLGSALEGLRKLNPILMDEVSVRVEGQPGASKQELYYLALAAANGVVRRIQPIGGLLPPTVQPTAASLRIEYDAADHWVIATISYRSSTVRANTRITPAGTSAAPINYAAFVNQLAVYRGPQCEVVGGKFDFIEDSFSLAGIPGTDGQVAPILPFQNRVILTGCPETQEPRPAPITQAPPPTPNVIPTQTIDSPNPKPTGDNRSRGAVVTKSSSFDATLSTGSTPASGVNGSESVKCCEKTLSLVELVFAALTDPGSTDRQTWVAPVQGPRGG